MYKNSVKFFHNIQKLSKDELKHLFFDKNKLSIERLVLINVNDRTFTLNSKINDTCSCFLL